LWILTFFEDTFGCEAVGGALEQYRTVIGAAGRPVILGEDVRAKDCGEPQLSAVQDFGHNIVT